LEYLDSLRCSAANAVIQALTVSLPVSRLRKEATSLIPGLGAKSLKNSRKALISRPGVELLMSATRGLTASGSFWCVMKKMDRSYLGLVMLAASAIVL